VTFSSKAIVLSKEYFGEADSYIQFFTKEWGMISLLARSARKSKRRYVGGLDLFCHDEIFVRGDPRERGYLQELVVLNSFPGIREKLERVWAAGKAVQWVKKLANAATPMPGVYTLLGQTLALTEKEVSDERLDLLTLVFKLKLLSQLGLKPRVDLCARCESVLETEVYFNLEAGGILCKACSKGSSFQDFLPLDAEGRLFLDYADRFKLSSWDQIDFPPPKTHGLSQLVTRFASFHTQTKLPQ
jgi:DNA repair protein RecO (recombination protein O)